MAERQIEHRKSCLVLSARFPVSGSAGVKKLKTIFLQYIYREQFHSVAVIFWGLPNHFSGQKVFK